VGVGGPFVDNDLEDELRLIDLNVVSVVRLAKYAVRDMVSRGSGRILFTSSIAAELPAPFLAVYGASKAFVQSFAEALHYELKDTGVTVTALQPGPTDTNFFERAEMMDTRVAVEEKDDPAEVARQGFEAMMAGKHRIVAGSVSNKAQSAAAGVLPEQVKARQHAKQTEPGSAEKARKKK
jgi:short-subunit dehydrogenase